MVTNKCIKHAVLKRRSCFEQGSVQHLDMSWDIFSKHRTAKGLERIHNIQQQLRMATTQIRWSGVLGYQQSGKKRCKKSYALKKSKDGFITFNHNHIRKGKPIDFFCFGAVKRYQESWEVGDGKWKKHTILHLYEFSNVVTNLPVGLRALRSAKRSKKTSSNGRLTPSNSIMRWQEGSKGRVHTFSGNSHMK